MLERLLDFVLKHVGGRTMITALVIMGVLAIIATITSTPVSPVTFWSLLVVWVVLSLGIEGLIQLMRYRARVNREDARGWDDRWRQAITEAKCTIWMKPNGDPEVHLPAKSYEHSTTSAVKDAPHAPK